MAQCVYIYHLSRFNFVYPLRLFLTLWYQHVNSFFPTLKSNLTASPRTFWFFQLMYVLCRYCHNTSPQRPRQRKQIAWKVKATDPFIAKLEQVLFTVNQEEIHLRWNPPRNEVRIGHQSSTTTSDIEYVPCALPSSGTAVLLWSIYRRGERNRLSFSVGPHTTLRHNMQSKRLLLNHLSPFKNPGKHPLLGLSVHRLFFISLLKSS